MAHNRIADGGRISAVWHGRAITGVVESSRVKYGGTLQYSVKLDAPIPPSGNRLYDDVLGLEELREYVLVKHEDVVRIFPGEDIHAGDGGYEAVPLSELKTNFGDKNG
jgi:hypothetical protein